MAYRRRNQSARMNSVLSMIIQGYVAYGVHECIVDGSFDWEKVIEGIMTACADESRVKNRCGTGAELVAANVSKREVRRHPSFRRFQRAEEEVSRMIRWIRKREDEDTVSREFVEKFDEARTPNQNGAVNNFEVKYLRETLRNSIAIAKGETSWRLDQWSHASDATFVPSDLLVPGLTGEIRREIRSGREVWMILADQFLYETGVSFGPSFRRREGRNAMW